MIGNRRFGHLTNALSVRRILTLDGYPHRGQPVCLTEFGGIAYRDPERYKGGREWGYQSAKDKEELAVLVTSLLEVAGDGVVQRFLLHAIR